jgi:hypothetical protein
LEVQSIAVPREGGGEGEDEDEDEEDFKANAISKDCPYLSCLRHVTYNLHVMDWTGEAEIISVLRPLFTA